MRRRRFVLRRELVLLRRGWFFLRGWLLLRGRRRQLTRGSLIRPRPGAP
ncbi:hypothetical protein GA0115257_104833, partial [Streptomyces sp. LcepLS]